MERDFEAEQSVTPTALRQRREAMQFTLRQMGNYLGVTGAAVSAWELGKTRVPKTVVKLIDALEIVEQLQQPKLPLAAIPAGECKCGCRGATVKNWRTDSQKGWIKGQYRDFIKGHNAKAMGRDSKCILEKA